jgi:uncharacterized membrane protein YadS
VKPKLNLANLVPWFIPGFLILGTLCSLALIPESLISPVAASATILTVVSMVALGLGVDLRVIGRVGGRVTVAVTLSLAVLLALSLGVVQLFS